LKGASLSIRNLVELDPRLDMLEIKPDENSRALIRASGTEPKLKCYLESTGPNRTLAKERLKDLERAMNHFLEQ
jgi:Phosphomannomutase